MTSLKPISYIHSIQSVAAPFTMKQNDSVAWLMKALHRGLSSEKAARALNLYERLLSKDDIETRNTVLSDYAARSWEDMTLFQESVRSDGSKTPWYAPPLQDRMKVYVDAALTMARKAFEEKTVAPRYILDVSCTGYRAPYPVQTLVMEKGWQSHTSLLKIGHMGCYASVPALNTAAVLTQSIDSQDTVSVLSTELCSLHLDPLATEPDQIVSNILFADGCSHITLGREKKANSLGFLAHYEAMVPDSAQYMAWDLHDSRFHMTLSRKVVTQLAKVIGSHVADFLEQQGVDRKSITRFAIHPGGPRIIESIQEALDLPDESVKHSKAVLKSFGNMSSATLPHVWKSMLEDPGVRSGELILSMAFGPGLTLTMNLLQKS